MTSPSGTLTARARGLSSGVGSVALGSLGARAAGLVSSLAAASLLGATDFGRYALLLAATTVIASLGGMGFAAPLTRSVAKASGSADPGTVPTGAVHVAAVTLSTLGVATVLLCWPGSGLVELPGGGDRLSVLSVGIWVVGMGCNPLFVAVLVALQEYRGSALLTSARGVLVAVAVTLACLTVPTAEAAAAATASAEVVSAGLAYIWLRRRSVLVPSSRRSWAAGARLLKVGFAAGAVGLAIQTSMWIGQVLLSRTPDGLAAAGLFLLATRLMLAVTFVPNALATVVLPRLTRMGVSSREDPRAVSFSYVALTAGIATVAALAVTTASIWFVPRLDEDYAGNAQALALMGVLAVLISLNNVYGSVVIARGFMGVWIGSDVMLAVALVVSAAALVGGLGVAGLALAHVVAYALSIGVLVIGSRPNTEGALR